MSSNHLRSLAWGIAPSADLTTASPTLDTSTAGTTVSAGVASTYGLPTDTVGFLVGLDASANNQTYTITNASATTRARSRFVIQRTDRVASRTVTVTGVTMARPHHNPIGTDLTTINLGIDEFLVLEKRSGSAVMEIVAGSACVGAAAA